MIPWRLVGGAAWAALWLAAPLAFGQESSVETAPPGNELNQCKVVLIDQVDLPAQVPGVLKELTAKVEMPVKKGQKLGQIDDEPLLVEKEIAEKEHEAAKIDSENDVNKKYAEESTKVAMWEYRASEEANKRASGAVVEADMKKLLHAWWRAHYSVLQAERDLEKYAVVTKQKEAQIKAVDTKLARTQIIAPFDGVVAEVPMRESEWVEPGKTVCRVIRLDRLYVKGRVNVADYTPEQLRNRSVKVTVELAHGKRETFDGTITVVHPELDFTGQRYEVWAEVENRQVDGEWQLRPNMEAEMVIDAGPGGPTTHQIGAAP